MAKKPVDLRPDEKPTRPDGDSHQPDREPGRMPGDHQGSKGFEKPEGRPIDKPFPAPGAGGTRKDAFDGGERSDRESGRPVQLQDEDEEKRSDRESGRPVELEADEGRFEQRKAR
jgi:hypothetical protein